MTILLLEPAAHYEVAANLAEALLLRGHRILLVCHGDIATVLPARVAERPELLHYTWAAYRYALKSGAWPKTHLVIWATLPRNKKWAGLLPAEAPALAVVHNWNTWFRRLPSVLFCLNAQFGVRKWAGALGFILFHRRAILSRLSGYLHLGAAGAAAVENSAYLPVPRQVGGSTASMLAGPVRIVVPGAVSSNGKDYSSLLRGIHFFSREHAGVKIHLYFLGVCQDEAFQETALQYLGSDAELYFFSSHVPAKVYNSIGARAAALILPLSPVKVFGGIAEYWGETTIPGGVADAQRWGKPLLYAGAGRVKLPYGIAYQSDQELAVLLQKAVQGLLVGETAAASAKEWEVFHTFIEKAALPG